MLLLSAMGMHGGDIYSLSEELRLPERKIMDFSASVNPLGVSKKIKAELRRYLKFLHHYPDDECRRLRRHISRETGIDYKRIICGNGSTELIYLTVRSLRPKKVLIPVPTFSEYERAVKMYNRDCRVDYIHLSEDKSFRLTSDMVINYLNDHDMIFICNPNNPTAQSVDLNDMKEIVEESEKRGAVVVVDEAFIDFEPKNSVLELVKNRSNTIVLRSMTKFYALTGLRLGYGIFPVELMELIKENKEPWTVNTMAQRAGVIALKDKHYRSKTFEYLKRERSFLERGLEKLKIRYFPSRINFYLIKHDKAHEILHRLRSQGILVRDCSNFEGLNNQFIRIAVRTHRENALLIKKLKEILI